MDALSAKALQEGALGLGTARYLEGAKTSASLPEGAQWRTVRVKFPRCSLSLEPNVCAEGVGAAEPQAEWPCPRARLPTSLPQVS